MKIILTIVSMALFNFQAHAQKDPLSPVQLEKGYICGIEVGLNIRELLYEGSHVTVERFMGEEVYILKYNFHIDSCGVVSAITSDKGEVRNISIGPGKYSTPQNALVGMTVKELKAIYPDAKIYLPEVPYMMEEFGYYFSVEGLGRFIIYAPSILEKCDYDYYGKCIEMISDIKSVRFETF